MNSSQAKDSGKESCEFQENLSILREIDFFSELPLEILKVLAYLCTREKYKEGDFLIQKGEDDGQAFYILSGRLGLLYDDRDKDARVVRVYGPEKFIGGTQPDRQDAAPVFRQGLGGRHLPVPYEGENSPRRWRSFRN